MKLNKASKAGLKKRKNKFAKPIKEKKRITDLKR
jgi:hypothetical protein